ncbi:MAG: hypothetical protein ACK4F8_15070 [Aquabacterium sp.]
MLKKIALCLIPIALSGCGSLTPTREVVEGYKIYDIQTAYSPTLTFQLASALKNTMQTKAKEVKFNNSLPPATLPEKPKRFEVVEPFQSTGLGAFMAMSGQKIRVPRCEGSVIDAITHDSFAGAEATTFYVCLIPYAKGYHMDVYYSFTKVSGGFDVDAMSRSLASAIAGDSSQFIPHTIAALENAVRSTGVEPAIIEQYPH